MLIRLNQPQGLAVDLDELKARLRIDTADDDSTLEKAIRSETRRYEDFTGRVLLPTSFEWQSEAWNDPICIPVAPVREVISVAYLDEAHAEQSLDPADWYAVTTELGVEIWFNDGFVSPALSSRRLPVRIRLSAGADEPGTSGSGDDPELAADENDQRNIMLMVHRLYDRDVAMPDEDLRRYFGNRRIFR